MAQKGKVEDQKNQRNQEAQVSAIPDTGTTAEAAADLTGGNVMAVFDSFMNEDNATAGDSPKLSQAKPQKGDDTGDVANSLKPPQGVISQDDTEEEPGTDVSDAVSEPETEDKPEELETGEPKEDDTESVKEDEPRTMRVSHVYGCIVRPADGTYLTEAKVALAWKEFNNVNSGAREIPLAAQAVDPITGKEVGEPIGFRLVPNDITHGSTSGRTIGFSGYLTRNVSTPNGGLSPNDAIGWSDGYIWVSIAFDLYDQIGRIDSYVNNSNRYELAAIEVSTALDLSPLPPITA